MGPGMNGLMTVLEGIWGCFFIQGHMYGVMPGFVLIKVVFSTFFTSYCSCNLVLISSLPSVSNCLRKKRTLQVLNFRWRSILQIFPAKDETSRHFEICSKHPVCKVRLDLLMPVSSFTFAPAISWISYWILSRFTTLLSMSISRYQRNDYR